MTARVKAKSEGFYYSMEERRLREGGRGGKATKGRKPRA